MQISGEHLDLLLSKLFHDLISPVSAARNGLETVREFGGDDVGADALDLVAQSVDKANDLTFFRMAFGGAGSSGSLAMHNVPDLAAGYLKSRKNRRGCIQLDAGRDPCGRRKGRFGRCGGCCRFSAARWADRSIGGSE